MLAGTVPFVSFYAERVVTRWIRRSDPAVTSGFRDRDTSTRA
jgi:hypothetical protein